MLMCNRSYTETDFSGKASERENRSVECKGVK